MNKILPIAVLLASALVNAHGPFQSGFFNQGFNNGFWRDFDQQFQRLDYEMNRFNSQSKQYFDKDSNSYVVEVRLSGLGKKDIDISTLQNTLVIKGSRNSERTSNNQNTKSSTNFSHTMSIPRDGDKDNISVNFKDSVLTVSIPKLDKPKPKVQKITIN
jgi:HSP20 family protein